MTRDSKGTMRHGERGKFTQTTRSLPARTAGARMRLVFALISVITLLATMFVTGPFQARVAVANPLANEGYGSLHRPSTGHISDQEDIAEHIGDDRGVATWVGGNMWIGAPRTNYADDQAYSRKVENGNRTEKPEPTYAVETEGLTLVGNKLVMNMVKGQWRQINQDTIRDDSWHRNGFRFGVVGFGGQIRPNQNSTVLSVNGTLTESARQYGSKSIDLYDGTGSEEPKNDGGRCPTDQDCRVNVYAFHDTGRGFVDYTQRYYVDVRGKLSYPINDGGIDSTTGKRYPLYSQDQNGDSSSIDTNAALYAVRRSSECGQIGCNVNWNYQSKQENDGAALFPNNASLFSKVYHNEEYLDFSNFQTNIVEKTSEDLAGLSNTGTTDTTVVKNETEYVREKYNYNKGNEHKYKLTMAFDNNQNGKKEKIIKFTGDGVEDGRSITGSGQRYKDGSHTQVFTVNASDLNSTGYNGISFEFDRIPEEAAVVVNVVGDQDIEFHNGWRFWWNGEDISNYYVQGNGSGTRDLQDNRNALYSRASSAIMWNFANTGKLTVRGGVVTSGQARWEAPKWTYRWDDKDKHNHLQATEQIVSKNDVAVQDDPAAAMIGSILVPKGTFESHVSTNGRVWVGGDFMMYNPHGLENYAIDSQGNWLYEDVSASLVCMDQERHNFIWAADYTDEAAPISWNKVNSEGERIGGTKWGVYNSLAAAQNKVTQQAPINAAHTEETKNKLVTAVTDDGSGDWDPVEGTLRTGGLTKNADYYIRELEAAPGHQLNDRIYRIDTTQAANNTTIVGVWEKKDDAWQPVLSPGNTMEEDLSKYMLKDITPSSTSDTASRVLGIINPEYPSVEWEKVDSETGEPLGGSEWQIWHTPAGNNQVTQVIAKAPNALTDSVSTRIYFSPGTANWSADGVYLSYLSNNQWHDVEFNDAGLDQPNGMRVASVPMRGASFTFKIWHNLNGNREYYQSVNGGDAELQAPENEGHYVVVNSTKQRAEIPACGMEYASKHDSDPREGRFKLIGLGQGEYMIHEHKVPAGHWDQVNGEKDEHLKFGFKVDGQSAEWVNTRFPHVTKQADGTFKTVRFDRVLPSSVKDGVGVIGNAPTEISWWKVDADDKDSNDNVKNTVLAGSEWQLQKWDDTANPKAYVDLGSTITDSATTTVYFASTVSNLANLKYGFNVNSSEDRDWMAATVSDAPQSCNGLEMATIPSEGKQFWLKIGGTTLEIAAGKGVVLVSTNAANNPVVASQIPACAVSGVQDLNPEPGKFTLKRLSVGKYRLKETKASLGYVLPADEYIYFEVTAKASETNGVQWKQGWNAVDDEGNPTNLTQGNKAPIDVNKVSDSEPARAVGNTRKPGEVRWEKIAQKPKSQPKQGQVDDSDTPAALSEEENHQLLAGSEWKLEYTKYGAVQSDAKPTKTLTIKDCMKETKNGTESKTFCTVAENGLSENDATMYKWAVDVEETAGKFKISGMPWGDYVLTESKAPDGYNLDATPHKFSIGVKTGEDGSTVVGTGGTVTDGNTTISIYLGKIENEPGVVLPMTGAEGRHLWPAIVGALFVLAAFGCAMALRMRE